MPIVLRQDKSVPLTFEELDGNFRFLDDSVAELQQGLSSGDNIPDSYIRSLFRAGGSIVYEASNGTISLNNAALVTGINGRRGEVTLTTNDIVYTTDDVSEGLRNLYYTQERVSNQIVNAIDVGSGLSKSNNRGTVTISPRNFGIRLTGAVTGNATVTALGDVTIVTQLEADSGSGSPTTPGITGVLVRSPGQLLDSEFQGIEFAAADFNVVASDTYVSISSKFSDADIVNVMGQVISGTVFGENLGAPTESGILVTFDQDNGAIRVAPRDFTIAITGAVTGSATVSRLQNTTITVANTNNYISGINTQLGGVTRNTNPIDTLNFSANDFEISAASNVTTIALKNSLTEQEVRDIIGNTIVGTERLINSPLPTETGIIVNYDAQNNKLEVSPRDFTIAITGAVTGSATVTKLRNTTITVENTNNYISGINTQLGGTTKNTSPITALNFSLNDFEVDASDNTTTIALKNILSTQDVRDIIGNTIVGTERSINASLPTETGIIVNYDAENNVLEVSPRDFTIAITGAVTGSATVSKLQNTTITVENINNYISGVNTQLGGVTRNTSPITALNFSLNDFEVNASDNTTTIALKNILSTQDVRDIIGNTIVGTERALNALTPTETGILINYDAENNSLEVAPRDFVVAIAGAVTGSATISRLRDTTITVANTNNYISGVNTQLGGTTRNTSPITALNFSSSDFDLSSADNTTTIALKNILSTQDVRDIIGDTIVGTVRDVNTLIPTETGIIVNYDAENNVLEVAPRDFVVAITGAVTGSATISRLRDTTITVANTNNYISGVNTQLGGTTKNTSPITALNFDADDFEVSASNSTTTIALKNILSTQDVRDIIGDTIVGTVRDVNTLIPTETGILINYDSDNNALEVAPRDFVVAIAGAVTGSATISRLRDTTITVENNNNYISGIDTQLGGVTRNTSPITALNFSLNDFEVSSEDNVTTIELKNILTDQAVRDIIGNTIVGTERSLNTSTPTESGINVNYDAENNVLEISPKDFIIELVGDVVGTTTISRLQNATINTTTSAIKGLDVDYNGNQFSTLVKKLDFSDNFSLTKSGDKVSVDINSIVDSDTILSTVGNAQTGAQNGIQVGYNSAEKQLSYSLSNLQVSLVGAVTGNATLSYQGRDTQTLSIVTEIGEVGSGLEIRDEGLTKGESIAAINFVGAGVTSSVTVDGQIATVNIPNSPAAEKFILIDNGSANVPNARRLVAGTGIILNDGGGGGDFTISATGGELLGKIQVESNGALVAEETTINVVNSQQVFISATHDGSSNTINIIAYSKEDGWWRQEAIDHGTITDKYGNSLDLGDLAVGIIEHQIDFGEIA